MAKIKAEEILGKDLLPGDLFSTRGPDYWDLALNYGSIGELVYVRTNIPATMAPDGNSKVYRITIDQSPTLELVRNKELEL